LSGTADAWINILEYPGHNVRLSGLGVQSGRIKFTGCNYIKFSGFEVTGYNQGIFIEGNSSNMTLDNLEVHDVGQEAIHIWNNSSHITVENSSIHDTCKWKNNGEGFYIGSGSSAALDNTNHITVRNNTIYNLTDEAVELKPGTHDCVVDGNTIYNACTGLTAYYMVGAICVNPHTSGNQFWGENPNHIISNNIVHSTATSGIQLLTGCKAYNNVIYDIQLTNAKGIAIRDQVGDGYTRYVYHNTINLNSANAIYTWEGVRDIRNNIGPATANNIATAEAYYIDAASGDYHLVSGSAPVNAGQDVGVGVDINGVTRPQGTGFDYGAYEYIE
jgi:hypothetical protein